MNQVLGLTALAWAVTSAAPAFATDVVFVPPSDTAGQVYTTGNNDGYSSGRGVVFATTADRTLTNVAIYQDLTNVTLNYSLRLATATTRAVGRGAVLASGSQTVTTNGLQFVDFALTPQTLILGTYYFLDFSFAADSNQNFFYSQYGAEPYSQSGFTGIDGTQNGNTFNIVLPRVRLTFADPAAPVPEPATWAMMIVGMGAVGGMLRRRQQVTKRISYAA